jgi:glycosyltransferase involved in cell wall biosynthesis
MTAPSVTAIVASKGRPELRRAVDRILEDDHDGAIDVIVVFDQCEPDRSFDVDPRVRVMTNQRTPGLAGGRNTGLLAATGDYVAFCDDDDEWRPGKLRAQFAALAAEPGAKAATCGIEIRFRDRRRVRIPDADRMTFDGFLLDRMTEAHPSTFVFDRRFLLDDVGFVDEGLPGSLAEDYDLLLRVARHSRIAVAPDPFVVVYWGESSFFSRRWQMTDDALGYLTEKYPEFETVPRGLARIRGQQAVARASLGDRSGAWRKVREALSLRPTEKRAYLALLISTGLVSGERAMRMANWFGRGL